jgi:hypothetical protein
MKFVPKFIEIPITLWENNDLSWLEKISMLAISSVTSDPMGVKMSPSILATMLKISKSEAKKVLNDLYQRGAIELNVDEDGVQRTNALIYKTEFPYDGQKKAVVEEVPNRLMYDYDFIIAQWNEINPDMPPLSRFTPRRKKQLRTCLSENGVSVEGLIKAFRIISVSDFLNGRTGVDWKASFDWLIKKTENLDKVLSGYYCQSRRERQDYQTILNGGDVEIKNSKEEESIYK